MQYEKGVIPIIEANYNNFTSLERNIADFFMKNEEEIDFSAKNISALLFTSEASLSRFAKKCGFIGYREFIYRYQETFLAEMQHVDEGTKHILNTYKELLNKAYSLIDEEQINRISGLIAEKRRIFIYGKGSSGVAAQELKLRFMRLGIDIDYITDSHVMTMNSVIVGEDSLVIGITVSGKTKEVLQPLATAKAQGATTVIISSKKMNEWETFCDEILLIAAKENLDLGKLISPQFPILVLGDVLYANVLKADRYGKETLHDITLSELRNVLPK